MKRTFVTLITLLALIGGGLALTLVRPVPLPRTIEVVPPVTSKLVCAPMPDDGVLFVNGADTVGQIGGDEVASTGPTVTDGHRAPVVIRGGSSLVGGVMTPGTDTRAWLPCGAPRSQGTLLVPGAAGTDLLIVNPDASEAVVDLTLYGADGELVALGARGIAVSANSSRTIALSVLVTGDGPVGVDYRASRGRATVVARTATPGVLAAATASTPGTEHWIPGIAEDATAATLLVTNPGTGRASVEVTAQGASAAYAPEGGTGISVPAHTTMAVELGASLAGEATGLHVTSDVEVAVGLSTGTSTDRAFVAPVSTSTTLGAFVPSGGVLQLSNPNEADTTVSATITTTDGTEEQAFVEERLLPAGTTITIPLMTDAPDGQVVTVTSEAAVFGAITDSAGGASIVALSATATQPPAPIDAEIVPTLR